MTASNPQIFGTVGATPISGDVPAGPYGLMATRTVTIGATAYVRTPPPGWPRADAGAPVASSLLAHPQTIAPGTTLTLFYAEAAALIAAGAAS